MISSKYIFLGWEVTKIKHRKKQDHGLRLKMERTVLRVLQSALTEDFVPPEFIHLWRKHEYLFCQVHRHEINEYENRYGIDFTVTMEINGEIHTRRFGVTTSKRYFRDHIVKYPHIRQFYFVPKMEDNRIVQPILALFRDVIH